MIYPTLKHVSPLDDHKLILMFGEDGKRIYDFKSNLNHKYYMPLRDIKLFKQVSVVDGEIEWITGQDFCPHTLYEQSTPVINDDS
ncbi:MAG: DUF2442 domain-containing protein [Chitinispirillales bacterium]|jgi:hypothetical protein|nr:DUF2442 domain-containing protein [Chitinispirillales bacterium]